MGGEEAREKEEDEKRIRKRKGKGKGLGNPSLVSLDVQQQKPAWVERKENHCFRRSFRDRFFYYHEVAAVLLRVGMQKAKG